MAVYAEERGAPTLVEKVPAADPAPLGLAAFARPDLLNSPAWFLLAFTIFNTYMLMWSTRVSIAVFAVFATLEATEILLAIGFFREAHGYSAYITHVGACVGIATAACAWYASAGGVINGMSPKRVLPVGAPLWGGLPVGSRRDSPMPRRREVVGGH